MSKLDILKPKKIKYSLRRIRLNSGGYTSSGTYYGHGLPLFEAKNKETGEMIEFRAPDRKSAKAVFDKALYDIVMNPLGVDVRFRWHELKDFAGTSYKYSPEGIAKHESHLAHIDRMNAAHEEYNRQHPDILEQNIAAEKARRRKVYDELVRKGFKAAYIRKYYPGHTPDE